MNDFYCVSLNFSRLSWNWTGENGITVSISLTGGGKLASAVVAPRAVEVFSFLGADMLVESSSSLERAVSTSSGLAVSTLLMEVVSSLF